MFKIFLNFKQIFVIQNFKKTFFKHNQSFYFLKNKITIIS